MRNAGLEETQLESRLLGEISITLDMQTTPPLWQKVKKQQLELDMEQQTDFKSGEEYIKAIYCYPAYLTYV